MVKRWWIIAGVIVAIVAVAVLISMNYSSKTPAPMNSTADRPADWEYVKPIQCYQDSDCFPKDCCHSKDCVAKGATPVCRGILCTQECAPGTLDCGQGSCACVDNTCKAIFNEPTK